MKKYLDDQNWFIIEMNCHRCETFIRQMVPESWKSLRCPKCKSLNHIPAEEVE